MATVDIKLIFSIYIYSLDVIEILKEIISRIFLRICTIKLLLNSIIVTKKYIYII